MFSLQIRTISSSQSAFWPLSPSPFRFGFRPSGFALLLLLAVPLRGSPTSSPTEITHRPADGAKVGNVQKTDQIRPNPCHLFGFSNSFRSILIQNWSLVFRLNLAFSPFPVHSYAIPPDVHIPYTADIDTWFQDDGIWLISCSFSIWTMVSGEFHFHPIGHFGAS